ncbi:MAG TPA: hypothetical protein VFG88_08650, partial [Nocardioidaceae bacterium]|nr:hypothetical protein [Nocardioidaceae bacterium]
DCAPNIVPQPEWFLYRETLALGQERQESGVAVLMVVAGLMLIAGTTFAGADWASGSMSNQLLFQPRRAKVWVAKGGAVFLSALVCSAVIIAGFWVVLYLAAQLRGIDTGAAVQEQIRWITARGTLLASLGAVGGYALTMLLRHTVGTLAVLFAYAAGGSALIAALPFAGAGRWSVANNVLAWVQDGYAYYDASICSPRGDVCGREVRMTLEQGATYLGVLLLGVLLVSLVMFRRRDVP